MDQYQPLFSVRRMERVLPSVLQTHLRDRNIAHTSTYNCAKQIGQGAEAVFGPSLLGAVIQVVLWGFPMQWDVHAIPNLR
jgi:hypothetical protein